MNTDDRRSDPSCEPVLETAMATGSEDGDPGERFNDRPLRPDDWTVLAAPPGSADVVEAVEDSPAAASAVKDDSVLPVGDVASGEQDDLLTPEFRAP